MAETGEKPKDKAAEFEDREWLDSLRQVHAAEGPERLRDLLRVVASEAAALGVPQECALTTPYTNTIPLSAQPPYPGDRALERRIKSIVRWNAMAMVVRANRESPGIGGHISTFASAATLYEVGFNHFFKGRGEDGFSGDMVFFQGHAAPGIYAQAFVEGRLTERDLENFRHELAPGGGLSSYPHPYLMPHFWEFPTVSMGLGPLMAIYQARFNQYLADRGIRDTKGRKVWAFLGDGEMDEPESLGAITLASRERLDDLIFVVNCNLQRLDGPVRGNGKIVQELEGAFRGAGWHVIKVLWGSDWDPLFAKDAKGLLARRLEEMVDGQSQRWASSDGATLRSEFWERDPELAALVADLTDEQVRKLSRGGHDPAKVYAAFKSAVEHRGSPTVILAHTVKGYGLGEAGEGKNITHQQKKLNEQELREFRDRFAVPIPEEQIASAPFFRFAEDSPEMLYLRARRKGMGGSMPRRLVTEERLKEPQSATFEELLKGSGEREMATTMALVQLLGRLLKDPSLGKRVVPIVPDEARTFGMEALFRQVGIYSHAGQLYEPQDRESFLYYREARDGAILEEGINEAGSMASFIAAGTSYATHGTALLPFFIFYSMFGFQRIGDLIWAAGDMGARGFVVGGTAGRTTLAGEGLQHQDGHSHLLAYPVPNLRAYDPAFAYELAVIVRDGIRRMVVKGENVFYYLTVMNEFYRHPPMPEGAEEGILRGAYRVREAGLAGAPKACLLGSGAILNEALKASPLLEERFGVAAEVVSVTSYKELHRDGLDAERRARFHPGEPVRTPHITEVLLDHGDAFVAASDYMKALPCSVAKWVPGPFAALGTDGFGRSEGRAALRDFFEVDARHIAHAALDLLARQGKVPWDTVRRAMAELEIAPGKPDPWRS
jgi:pyruvate dehydrogenase E1 component